MLFAFEHQRWEQKKVECRKEKTCRSTESVKRKADRNLEKILDDPKKEKQAEEYQRR